MNNTNDQALIALRLIFASETYESLCSEIEDVYQAELKAAKQRATAIAAGLIKAQLKRLPTLTFGIDTLSDSDLETLASGFIPDGATFE